MTEQNGQPDRAWLSVYEAADLLGISGMSLYRAIAQGTFPAVRIGKRICVPAAALDQLADAAMEAGAVVDAADWRKVLKAE